MKIQLNKKGFTLVELMVAMTIFFIIVGATYMNFSYYQNKMNLKLTSKDISQALYGARNLAINGLDSSSGNVSVGVFFDNSTDLKTKIYFYTYPFDLDLISTDLISTSEKKLFKEVIFHEGVELNNVEGYDKFLFLFESISGSGSYYYWDSTPGKKVFSGTEIDIKISFKGTDSPVMSKVLKYITGTNIVDY